MSDNNRNYYRVPMGCLIEFSECDFLGDRQFVPSTLKGVSGGGVLFESPHPMEIGTMLKIKLKIPGRDKYKMEF
ncbi:MAG: PilZ domain-containing protein [Proteobacteria bacterium]|nr:PilZ domain-containing protein [Pseudomonadota bacterium]